MWYEIERRRCPCCPKHREHRILPPFLAPYKHYDLDIITGVLNGSITPETEAFQDYPCEATMKRWQKWLALNLVFINQYMKSVGARLLAVGMALLLSANAVVEELRERNKRNWLRIVLRVVYNTGESLEPYRERSG